MTKAKKVLSLILVLVMCVVVSTPVYALEAQASDLTLEEAADILGVDVEELEGMEIRRLPSLGENKLSRDVTPIPSTLEKGIIYYEDITAQTFTGAIHKANGTRFAWGATLYKLNGKHTINFTIQKWYTDYNMWVDYCDLHNQGDKYNSGFSDIRYGREFYFTYFLNNGSAADNNKVRIVVTLL